MREVEGRRKVTPAPIGVGVIGLGEIGQFHVSGYARLSDVRLAAVADLNDRVVSSTVANTAARGFSDYHGLLEDRSVEVVSICLPHALHKTVAVEAVSAGKHVLVEKPLALTVAECQEIIEAATAAGVTAGVQHNQIFYPPHVRARELVASGAIGELVHLRLRLAIGGKFKGWRADPALTGGGLMFDSGVHRVYMARFLGGEIEELTAMTDRDRFSGEDQAIIALRFVSGAMGVIDANYHGPPGMFDDSIEVVGRSGALYLSGCEAEFEGFRTGPALRRYDGAWHDERVDPGNWADSVHASIAAFVEAVRQGTEPPVPLQEGRRVLELVEAIHSPRPSQEVAA